MERESSNLEYKEAITNSFLKTVSAFANYQDGRIIFGVRDDGTICGIAEPVQTCLDIENKINDSISPAPEYTLQVNQENKTITLSVKKERTLRIFIRTKPIGAVILTVSRWIDWH